MCERNRKNIIIWIYCSEIIPVGAYQVFFFFEYSDISSSFGTNNPVILGCLCDKHSHFFGGGEDLFLNK